MQRSKKQKIKRLQAQCAEEISKLLERFTQDILELHVREAENEQAEAKEEDEPVIVPLIVPFSPPPVCFDQDTQPEYVTMSLRIRDTLDVWKETKILMVKANGKEWYVQANLIRVSDTFAIHEHVMELTRHPQGIESCRLYKGSYEYDVLMTMGLSRTAKHIVLLDASASIWNDLIKRI